MSSKVSRTRPGTRPAFRLVASAALSVMLAAPSGVLAASTSDERQKVPNGASAQAAGDAPGTRQVSGSLYNLAAQTSPTPIQPSPAQRDATRPPGTEQRQTAPPGTTRQTDPTAPPGTERTSPQAPPGTQLPRETTPQRTTPQLPAETSPAPLGPQSPVQTTPGEDESLQELLQPRPLPPMPSLARIGVISGDTLALTLNEAVRRALENNNDIEVARGSVRLAEAQLLSLRGIYDPVITFRPEYNSSISPVVNIFGGANQTGTVSRTDFNNDFAVSKQFGKGGGNYQYFFNNTRETTDASNQTLNPFYSSNQGLTFTQPLWRNRSIDNTRRNIRIQQKRLEQSDAEFRRRTIEVIAQVQRAYWDLVFALRDEQNQIANLNLARENFRRTEASVAAGAVAPLERAEIQTELSNRESALLLATQGVTIAENNLKNLILRDPLSADWSRIFVPTDQPAFDETPVTLETALKEARDNRPELRRLRIDEEISDIDIKYFKNQTKPQINLTGTLSTTGLAGTPNTTTGTTLRDLIGGDAFAETNADAFLLQQLNRTRTEVGLPPITPPQVTSTTGVPQQFDGGYFRTLRNLFSFDTRNVVAGVTISIPLRNRTAEANLAAARIEREQLAASTRATEQVIEVEVRNAAQSVETSRRRVLAAREARENAELQLAGERRLYQVGRSTTFLLFQRENALVNARNQELRAETDYNKALAELQRATSTTLRVNNVIIETPTMD